MTLFAAERTFATSAIVDKYATSLDHEDGTTSFRRCQGDLVNTREAAVLDG
jgi:hypothetical protein